MTTYQNNVTGEIFEIANENEALRIAMRTYVGLKLYIPIPTMRGFKIGDNNRRFATAWALNVTDTDFVSLERFNKWNLSNTDDDGKLVFTDKVNEAIYQQEIDGINKFKGSIIECVEMQWITKKDRRDEAGEKTRQVPVFRWEVKKTTKEDRDKFEKEAKKQFAEKFTEMKKEEETEE